MWVLLLVFLNCQCPGIVLKTFDVEQDCQIERDYVGYEMAEAYPYEADFRIECQGPKPVAS